MATGASHTTQAPQLSGTRLTPGKHFTILYDFLSKHAAKWWQIGLHLGFLQSELKLIHGNSELRTSSTSILLSELLDQWLQWAPGDGRGSEGFATVENLRSALYKVGLGAAASELDSTEFDSQKQLDHSTSKRCKKLKLSDEETDPTPAISRYAYYLRRFYKRASISPDKFPQIPCENSKFISLALVKKERISRSEADDFTKTTVHGHIDEILQRKEPIKMEDMLKPTADQPDINCVFVEGAPGIGKSTFCWEFCRRWDEIEALKKFKLVYLLRLRDKRVQETKTVSDLFYHEDCKLSNDVASEVLQCEGKGVLLVLDGFDELPVSLRYTDSLFVRLIRGSSLPCCTVLVTSRPSASADLLKVAKPHINKRVELLGFTQEHIEEYARSIFSSQADNMLADFLKYISVNPAIRSMMYIPLNSAIVVEVYRANKTTGSPIPQTMTQLYSELINVLLKRHRYLFDRGNPLAEDLRGLEDITPQNNLYTPLCALAKLAFDGIKREEVIFYKLPDGCDHFGLMNESNELYIGSNRKVSFSFLHLTLQEFLAAFHISQLSADEQKLLFEKYHFEVVWRFVAGLTGFKGIKDAWKVFEDMKRGTNPFYIRCLYEAQEKVDCNSVFPESKDVSYECDIWMQLFDYYALGYCVSASRCKWELRMGTTEFDGDEFEMLSYQLQDSGGENIASLNIGDYDYSIVCSPAFLERLAQLVHNLVKLKEFTIISKLPPRCALVKVFDALSELEDLYSLEVELHPIPDSHSSQGGDDVAALSQLIKQSKSLKKLKLHYYLDIPFNFLQLLAEAIFSSSSLNEVVIDMSWNEWNWSSGINPFAPLEYNHSIGQLTLLLNPTLDPIPYLAKALQKNTALNSLRIGRSHDLDRDKLFENSDLTTTSVTELSEMIKVNHKLECLAIKRWVVTRNDILTLNKALLDNTTPEHLELRWIYVLDCSDPSELNELDHRISDNIEEHGLMPF